MEQTKRENIFKKPWMHSIIVVVVIFGSLAGFLLWQSEAHTVSIENSYLDAPVVNLSPTTPGTLQALYVKEGDRIAPNTAVALVGSETLTAPQGGIVSSASDLIGQYFNPGQTVVSVVDDADMQVVGSLEENKGLQDVKVGQRATFSADAFPGKIYEGVVSEISPTSEDTGVVFSISDKRPTKNFDVKVRFDVASYPELKNGMSAKITVYTN